MTRRRWPAYRPTAGSCQGADLPGMRSRPRPGVRAAVFAALRLEETGCSER
jgi:hypothetical protein